nr:hypothetical protein StreXyl84_26450 [Streptomyces sp. Xyl84]
MAGTGSGGGTSFENMSHEQMLAWLDQANSGEVQAAATRLAAAAKEIRKIAEELKVRPQWVEWKGEGADAFRVWANDLANSTHRLGDFSENSAKWLTEASNAIATAQASIPRDTKSAHANLVAATAAHNDPDATAIRTKSAAELAALQADQEKVRLEAAAQMRKLGQSYEHSATQMNTLPRPKFPPPPAVIAPPAPYGSTEDVARPTGSAGHGVGSSGSYSATAGTAGTFGIAEPGPSHDETSGYHSDLHTDAPSTHHLRPLASNPVTHVGIDSVSAPPEVHKYSPGPVGVPAGPAHTDPVPLPSTSGQVPPLTRGSVRAPSGSRGVGKPVAGVRLPAETTEAPIGRAVGRGGTAPTRNTPAPNGLVGRAVPGQGSVSRREAVSGSGITGGRPAVPPAAGRSMPRAPSGPLGGTPAANRGSTSGLPNAGVTRKQSTNGVPGSTVGRAGAAPRGGIVGGTAQRTGRAPVRPGAPVPSASMRGGISGGLPNEEGQQSRARGASSGSANESRQRDRKQKKRRRNEPPASE